MSKDGLHDGSGQHKQRDLVFALKIQIPSLTPKLRKFHADSAGDEGAQGLTGSSLHVADQHDIAVRCPAIHDQLLAVSREVESLDQFAVEMSDLFAGLTRNRLAPDVRNAALEFDI